MSNTQNCSNVCWQIRSRHVLVSFLFLMVSSLTHHNRISLVEGRAISKLIEAAQKEGRVEEEKMVRVVVRALQIGSRPPRCERRCSGCGHCEAVLVPVVPGFLQNHYTRTISTGAGRYFFSHQLSGFMKHRLMNSRGDDFSNYKPMSWKCKCGDILFNP